MIILGKILLGICLWYLFGVACCWINNFLWYNWERWKEEGDSPLSVKDTLQWSFLGGLLIIVIIVIFIWETIKIIIAFLRKYFKIPEDILKDILNKPFYHK